MLSESQIFVLAGYLSDEKGRCYQYPKTHRNLDRSQNFEKKKNSTATQKLRSMYNVSTKPLDVTI